VDADALQNLDRTCDNALMAADAPTPLPLRPSAAERERIARFLRDRSVEGRLSLDTFSYRVERALEARHQDELDELISDLHPPRGPRRLLVRAVEWVSGLAADLQSAWERPRVAPLSLPPDAMRMVTLGRAGDCDCVLAEETVSRRHALLRRDGQRWLLRDLGSLNGTRVNGMRVLGEIEVRPGDRVSFGCARYRLTLAPGTTAGD
jgi:FHA domain/Domain of unknown function (DUF1707)